MKNFVNKFGIAALMNVIAAVVALAMTIIGVYCVDEVFCYELECAIIWAVGTIVLVTAIRGLGEAIDDYKRTKRWYDK